MNLADVITFQGRSIDDLKQALADSVEDYLEFCALKGRKPEKPYSGRFNVRIAPELHQRIAQKANADGKSLNHWVAEALDHAPLGRPLDVVAITFQPFFPPVQVGILSWPGGQGVDAILPWHRHLPPA